MGAADYQQNLNEQFREFMVAAERAPANEALGIDGVEDAVPDDAVMEDV